ncbi:hypothetical protein CDD81_548 [Ophiocordyceps australis]|uniref:Uncharacterized protein n=1 Tax=Ophiocordyceps australis TaxID=1399860 RepID=A0A2C5YEI8_9HYPO|nr:hypothetical protein CDD81_548 [Ophiocordyceps australis]
MYIFTTLAILFLASATALPIRVPFPMHESPPAAIILNQAALGISRLGPTGGLRADNMFPKGGGMPFKHLPGGLPELVHPPRKTKGSPGKQRVGVERIPGSPLGPKKKQGVVENLPPWSEKIAKPPTTPAHLPPPPPPSSPRTGSSTRRPLAVPLKEKPIHSHYLDGKYP